MRSADIRNRVLIPDEEQMGYTCLKMRKSQKKYLF